jgi:hypothetical protein
LPPPHWFKNKKILLDQLGDKMLVFRIGTKATDAKMTWYTEEKVEKLILETVY